MPGILGFGKKEEIFFPERKPWSELGLWTQEELVQRFFKPENLSNIYTIKVSRELGARAEKEATKIAPPLKLFCVNDILCYVKKDEQRLHDFMLDLEKRIEQERAAAKPEQPIEQKVALDTSVQIANQGAQQAEEDFLQKMGLAEEPDPLDSPPTDIEHRWAMDKIIEEEKEIRKAEKEAGEQPAPKVSSKRKKRKSLGRTNQIMTRLTDSELTQFNRRVRKSGLAQGDFIRSAVLNGKIVIEENNVTDVAVLDELAMIRAELGRQGGMLKMIIKPNEGQRELTPDEWAELIGAIRDLDDMKKRFAALEGKVNGNNQTHHVKKR